MTRREWLRVTHSAAGLTSVTVTLVQGDLSVRWSVKTFASTVAAGIVEARAGAERALADLVAAL